MSSPYPRFAFVDAPRLDATDRLVLTEGAGRITKTEFSLGSPSLSGAPGEVGVEWSYRDLKLRVRIRGSRSDATSLLQQLAREVVSRADNWLLVQLGPEDTPVWFKTYRTQPGELDLSNDVGDTAPGRTVGQWSISVPLSADPFAYGERVTVGPFTVNNDPAAGTNPCRVVLPEIIGDVPAPARLAVSPSNRGTVGGYRWLHHMHITDAPDPAITIQFGTGDGFTAGADTNGGSPGGWSGGSARLVSFATNTALVDRIKGNTAVAVPAGRYKAFVRVNRNDLSSKFSLRLGQASSSGYEYGPTKVMARPPSTAVHTTWVYLGDFTFPLYTGVPLEEAGAAAVQNIALQVGRTSGAGSAYLDVIKLLAIEVGDTIETRTMFTDLPMAAAFDVAGKDIWDGDAESYWKVDNSGNAVPLARPDMIGGFARVHPGQVNTLTVLPQVNGTAYVDDNSDVLTATTSVTVSYHPLYLNLAA